MYALVMSFFVFCFYRETQRLRSLGFLFSGSAMHLWKVKLTCLRDSVHDPTVGSELLCCHACPVFPPKVTVRQLLCDVELYYWSVCAQGVEL